MADPLLVVEKSKEPGETESRMGPLGVDPLRFTSLFQWLRNSGKGGMLMSAA